jgi:hypothetical protein
MCSFSGRTTIESLANKDGMLAFHAEDFGSEAIVFA